MPTVSEILIIAKKSQYLSLNAIKRGGTYGGGINITLPSKIYNIRKSIEWLYNLDPNNSTLTGAANYLYGFCGIFAMEAQAISGSGSAVSPVVGGTAVEWQSFTYYITATDVANNYFVVNSVDLTGKSVKQIFSSGNRRGLINSTSAISVLVPEDTYWFNPSNARFTYLDSPLVEGQFIQGEYSII